MKQHSPQFLKRVNEIKKNIKEIPAVLLKEKLETHQGVHLIDVREDHEWDMGHLPGAIHISKGVIERDIEQAIPETEAPIVLYCSGGFRSALAADSLLHMGYQNVLSLEKGSSGWVEQGYEMISR